MGLVNLVFSTAAKCLDAVFLLLDLNFVIVHSLVRTVLAITSFINSIPALLLCFLLEISNYTSLCLLSIAEVTSDIVHGTVTVFGSLPLAVEGLLESLKMVGYLSMHILIRGKDHLCRGLLSLQEGCGIVVSLVVYFTNTVVNFVLIAIQNLYLGVVGVLQTVSSPLHKVVELTLTSLTFLYSCLAGTTAFLWEPFKLLIDFFISLIYVFIKIFVLNIYGFMLTVIIAVTTTAYLNPELTQQAASWLVEYINSFPLFRRLRRFVQSVGTGLHTAQWHVNETVQRLQRIVHCLYVLERRLWQQVSRHSSQLLALRARRTDREHRAGGDGDAGEEEERRDPPDGRANENTEQEQSDSAVPSSSTHKPPNKHSKDKHSSPEEDLLNLLKEQEERKKCVICQDSTKTVVLLPCRHLCLCRDCTDILLRQPIYQQNCPLCRHMILNTMDVYL
ncbi:E3 ubiquitin-protein ligase RNF26 [Boleophthalmus pectinirostris]|uniref:E3 ubiquitin-protein ligase RNF26 n=1 Tax=Boleophthalmus pectinirostris TaxID=150288 RepID=UPI00242E3A62|nr:E3 ubiquitin-protein ligase RNF26 [Boleophthalmus pectinirostris]